MYENPRPSSSIAKVTIRKFVLLVPYYVVAADEHCGQWQMFEERIYFDVSHRPSHQSAQKNKQDRESLYWLVTNGGGAAGRRRSTTVGIDVSMQTSSLPFPVTISISSPLMPLLFKISFFRLHKFGQAAVTTRCSDLNLKLFCVAINVNLG